MNVNFDILLRVVIYRILALIATAIIVGIGDAVKIHIILTLIHFAFEKFWNYYFKKNKK